MTYRFNNVLIRSPNKSIERALSSKRLSPKFKNINKEHKKYVQILNKIGLKINLLKPLEEFPDSIFIEDPALIYKSTCIILNPFDPSRNGEANIISKEIKEFFDNILFVDKGFVEGGDILNINDHFIIGLSNRTNQQGAVSLLNILNDLGASVTICKTPNEILHFKSECSLIDDDVILVSKRMGQLNYLKSNYKLIELPLGEEGAANSLRINNKLLIPDGFIKSEEILSQKYDIIKIKTDEIRKVDAGLSCMSLRW